jgi:hypothetical protein
VVSLESKTSSAGGLFVTALPELDEAQHRPGLLALEQVGQRITDHLAVGVLGHKDQDRLLAAAAFGQIMPFDEIILPEKGDGMKVQIETGSLQQFFLAQHGNPGRAQPLIHRRRNAVGIGGQVGGLGRDVESGKQGQPLVEDQVHDMTLALAASQFQGQQRQ